MRRKGTKQSGYGVSADEANKIDLPCVHGHKGRWIARYTKQGRKNRTCQSCDIRRTKLSNYGLSEEHYKFLLVKHDEKCFICGLISPLKIDHDHSTGEVRALLCQRCNTLVGWMESPLAERAAVYVKMFKEKLVTWQQAPKPKTGSIA